MAEISYNVDDRDQVSSTKITACLSSVGMTEVPKDAIFQITGPSRSRQSSSIEDGTGSSSQHFHAKRRKLLSRVEIGVQVKRLSFVVATEASSNI